MRLASPIFCDAVKFSFLRLFASQHTFTNEASANHLIELVSNLWIGDAVQHVTFEVVNEQALWESDSLVQDMVSQIIDILFRVPKCRSLALYRVKTAAESEPDHGVNLVVVLYAMLVHIALQCKLSLTSLSCIAYDEHGRRDKSRDIVLPITDANEFLGSLHLDLPASYPLTALELSFCLDSDGSRAGGSLVALLSASPKLQYLSLTLDTQIENPTGTLLESLGDVVLPELQELVLEAPTEMMEGIRSLVLSNAKHLTTLKLRMLDPNGSCWIGALFELHETTLGPLPKLRKCVLSHADDRDDWTAILGCG